MNNMPAGERIDVAPLREAFERSGMTLYATSARLGWYATRRVARWPADRRTPDTARLRRALGMSPVNGRYWCRTIGRQHAHAIACVIGADPVEVGL